MLTIREQLQLMDSIRKKNDAAFAEAARQQAWQDMWQTWKGSLISVVCGVLVGLLVVWIAG